MWYTWHGLVKSVFAVNELSVSPRVPGVWSTGATNEVVKLVSIKFVGSMNGKKLELFKSKAGHSWTSPSSKTRNSAL